jgi:hypothetical protein
MPVRAAAMTRPDLGQDKQAIGPCDTPPTPRRPAQDH